MATTELERTIQQEQGEHDAAQDTGDTDAEHADEKGQATLIDRSQYEREDLAIPKIDGNAVDRIAITFSGTVFLDRSDPADVALFNRLRLQQDVTLMVEGKCSKTGGEGATDRDGDLDVVIGKRNVKVTTVYRPITADTELEEAA